MKPHARRVDIEKDKKGRWWFWDSPRGAFVIAPIEEWNCECHDDILDDAIDMTLEELKRVRRLADLIALDIDQVERGMKDGHEEGSPGGE